MAARSFVAAAEKPPSAITITTPLKARPPGGRTLVDLLCDATPCANQDDALRAATAAVGWTLKTIPFKNGDPATLLSAMQDALRYKPVAVVLPGVDTTLWASEVPAYEQANIPLITTTITGLPRMSSPLVGIETEPYDAKQGQAVANWFIDNSKDKGKAPLLSIPAFPLFQTMTEGFDRTVEAGCGGCTVKHLDLTIPQLQNHQVAAAAIAVLRRDPSIDYLIAVSGTFVEGLRAQLRAAGLGKVVVGCALARQDTMADLRNGDLAECTNQGEYTTGWMVLDAVLRLAEGSPLPRDAYAQGPAVVLLNKDNVGSPRPSWNAPADYAEQFKRLWHVA